MSPVTMRPSPLLSPPCFEWYLLVLKSCCGSSDQCSVICCSSTALHNPGWELFISLGCWGWAFLEVSHWTVRSYQTLEMSPVLPGSQSPPEKLPSSYSVQNLSCSFASIIHFCPQIFLCCSLLRKKKKKKREQFPPRTNLTCPSCIISGCSSRADVGETFDSCWVPRWNFPSVTCCLKINKKNEGGICPVLHQKEPPPPHQ